jgi:large subunit ribosomal protein L4
MLSVVFLNQLGEEIGTFELSEEVFGVNSAEHQQAVFETILAQRAAMRHGTQKAKTRSEVSGGGKKPWRQKGTGRARQGSIRAPQWRGGGVVFAPTPRKYNLKVNKKVVKLATKCALSDKLAEGRLFVVDTLSFADHKTKNVTKLLGTMNNIHRDTKVLVISAHRHPNLELATRNISNILLLTREHANVYDIMNTDLIIITSVACKEYEEVLR